MFGEGIVWLQIFSGFSYFWAYYDLTGGVSKVGLPLTAVTLLLSPIIPAYSWVSTLGALCLIHFRISCYYLFDFILFSRVEMH